MVVWLFFLTICDLLCIWILVPNNQREYLNDISQRNDLSFRINSVWSLFFIILRPNVKTKITKDKVRSFAFSFVHSLFINSPIQEEQTKQFWPKEKRQKDRQLHGWIQDLKLGGRTYNNCAEWREARKFWRYFVWKITILRQKIVFFSSFTGGACRVRPLWIRPCILPGYIKAQLI